jgi:hypothetical protein
MIKEDHWGSQPKWISIITVSIENPAKEGIIGNLVKFSTVLVIVSG